MNDAILNIQDMRHQMREALRKGGVASIFRRGGDGVVVGKTYTGSQSIGDMERDLDSAIADLSLDGAFSFDSNALSP